MKPNVASAKLPSAKSPKSFWAKIIHTSDHTIHNLKVIIIIIDPMTIRARGGGEFRIIQKIGLFGKNI